MKAKCTIFFVLGFTLAGFSAPQIERDPIGAGAAWEFGQFVKAVSNYNQLDTIRADPFNRLGVALTQKMTADNRFELSLGVGGLFWNAFPIQDGANWALETKFGPGITEAVGTYHFGELEKRNLYLQFGFFPIKYNENALNLGEYLFRSGTYPPLIFTAGPGSWQFVNGAFYDARGLRLHWETRNKMLVQDFALLFETRYPPLFDITPTYIARLNLGDVIQVGAGMSYNHLLPMIPSKVRPKTDPNLYVEINNLPPVVQSVSVESDAEGQLYVENGGRYYDGTKIYGMWPEVSDKNKVDITDTAGYDIVTARYYHNRFNHSDMRLANEKPQTSAVIDQFTGTLVDSVVAASQPNNFVYRDLTTNELIALPEEAEVSNPNLVSEGQRFKQDFSEPLYDVEGDYLYPRKEHYFTFKGIKLMGMLSFDPKPLLGGMESMNEKDLTLFAEVALLGVENQPLYFENRLERMPVMFGMHLPTFKLLDFLSFQAEYYKHRFPLSSRGLTLILKPSYDLEGKSGNDFDPITYDDWKWSVLGCRSWAYGKIYLQMASDHIRTNAASSPTTYYPLTLRPSDWYYIVRFEFGL